MQRTVFHSAFQYQRPRYATKLNLVALMDIFTILVFFLLLNTGEAEKIQEAKFVQLPDSHAGTPPHGDLVVMIGQDAIWLGNEWIVGIAQIAASESFAIDPLAAALADYRERKGEVTAYEKENGFALTIMGDQAVPYALLKAVMVTCRQENFRDIALAVNQIQAPSPAAPVMASASVAGR